MLHTEQITTRDAADVLGIHPRTVARLVERNELTPAARLDIGRAGTFLFDPAEVERVRDLRATTTETAK